MKYTFYVRPHRSTHVPLEEFVVTGKPHEVLQQLEEMADRIMQEDQDYLEERG
jgi:hypothetical protein